ncbi:MAG TPA: SusC/RagA family TonB-linked outer membrane protein [Longimicrobiales bacterium]
MRRVPCWLSAAALAVALLVPAAAPAQQESTVSGRVTDAATGQPLAGVQVSVKGTAIGTVTDGAGSYLIRVPEGATTLVFAYLGYTTVEAEITGATVNVQMQVEAIGLEGLVVTALGMTRERRDVGYSIQTVGGEEIADVPEANLVNALAGEAAGVQVTGTGLVGGSSRIILRGSSSISGNNQPLFVIDGIPIDNSAPTNNGFGGGSGGGIDYGNAAADIDPSNIESITVLKGPNAAALYGSRAANGAIVITTKSGRRGGVDGGLGITASTSVMFATPLRLPKYQNKYGQGFNGEFNFVDGAFGGINDGADESWGPEMKCSPDQLIDQFFGEDQPFCPQPDNVRNFFDLGKTYTTNVAIARSGEQSHYRLSISRMDADDMGPGGLLDRTSFLLAGGVQVNDRLSIEANANYIRREGENLPGTGYSADNYLQQFTWFGRQVDISKIENYKNPDGSINNWNYNYHDNPYWIAYENWDKDVRDRIIGRLNVNYQLTDWLSARLTTGRDWYEHNRQRGFAKGSVNFPDGRFEEDVIRRSETNTDFILTATRGLTPDITVTANAGASRRDNESRIHNVAVPTLVVPGIYSLQNAGSTPDVSDQLLRKRVNSLYGAVSFNYKGFFNVDVTGRNDWSSTLPEGNNSFFYPSVSSALVFTDAFGIQSSILSSGKVRASWTRVGNDTDPYQLLATYSSQPAWEGIPRYTVPNQLPNSELKPEETTAWEVGADLGFLDERLGFVLTYYDERTRNQILGVDISAASGYTSQVVNAGEVRNWGYELLLRAMPIRSDNFTWETTLNFALPKNEVVALHGDVDAYSLGASYWSLEIQARKGRPYGVLWGNPTLRTEDGRIVVDENGIPMVDPEKRELGNYNPDWIAGLRNRLTYKDFDLSFLIDTKQGGEIFSTTIWWNRYSGVAEETLQGRENYAGPLLDENGDPVLDEDGNKIYTCDPGILVPNSVQMVENADGTISYVENTTRACPQDYFHAIFGNHERGIVDASFIKLREVTLGWNVPESVVERFGFSSARLSLIGRNLWLWTPEDQPHIDPETLFDTGNRQGVEFGQFPTPRSIGFSVTIQP